MPDNNQWQVVSETPAQQSPAQTSPSQSGQSDPWTVTGESPASPYPINEGDKGAINQIAKTGTSLLKLPGAIWAAFTNPPDQNDPDEVEAQKAGGAGAVAVHRLIVKPMQREKEVAQAYDTIAKANYTPADWEKEPDRVKRAVKWMSGEYSGSDVANDANHKANMHHIASLVPLLGPLASDITEHYLAGDKSGAVASLLSNIAVPKVMEGTGKMAIGALNKVASKAVPAAEHMYQSSLKPSTTNTAAQNLRTVRTGLATESPISEAGMTKLSGLINDLDGKIEAEIAKNPDAPISKFSVASKLNGPAEKFAQQVAPAADLEHISNVGNEFLESQDGPIAAKDAQSLKKGTYQRIGDRAYGEEATARVEAEKALARGLKEELENHFPEIKDLNAEQSKLLDLKGSLEKAVTRATNRQTMPARLGGPLAGTIAGGITTAAFGHGVGLSVGTAVGILKTLLDDPGMQSRLAIAISKAGKTRIPYDAASFRVQQFVNSLSQSQQHAQDAQQSQADQGTQ